MGKDKGRRSLGEFLYTAPMSTSPRYQSCERKVASTREGAERRIKRQLEKRGVQMYSYECWFCKKWHLTSRPPRE